MPGLADEVRAQLGKDDVDVLASYGIAGSRTVLAHGVQLTPTWAFVSWRPDNDWLLRLGKQRLPLFLNTENRDVGQTYDLLRLPGGVHDLRMSVEVTQQKRFECL